MSYLESLFSLARKTAVVTGAARGNGKAIAEGLLRAGARVILVDILEDELVKVTESFRSKGLNSDMFFCDLAQSSDISMLVSFLVSNYSVIDILVNNAGVTFSHSIFGYPDDYWEKTYRVNLKAPFELSRAIAEIMKEKNSGVIINITSLNAELAFPDNPAYVAFKGALKQLSKSLAFDLGRYGIRVNCVGPGYFRTCMTKKSWDDISLKKKLSDKTILGRWGEPSDLAGVVIFLSSEASSYITGQDIYVDGGWLAKGL